MRLGTIPSLRISGIAVATSLLFLFGGLSASAQTLTPFLPPDCENSAKTSANSKVPNSSLIAVLAFDYDVDLLGTAVNLGMTTETGKASLWIYVFRSTVPKDTAQIIIQARVFGSCIDPSALLGATNLDVPLDGLGNLTLPSKYINGVALFTALKTSASFKTFSAKFPGKKPTLAALGSVIESIPGFDAGTSAWLLTWNADSTDPNSGMTCVVDATTGKTYCIGDELLAVSEVEAVDNVLVFPNPASDVTTIQLPEVFIGTSIQVQILNSRAEATTVYSGLCTTSLLTLDIRTYSTGYYSLRVQSNANSRTTPISIIK